MKNGQRWEGGGGKVQPVLVLVAHDALYEELDVLELPVDGLVLHGVRVELANMIYRLNF